MNIKIIGIALLFSFPGGLLIAGIGIAIGNALKRINVKGIIRSIKAMGSMVFAEEFSLDGLSVDDRADVILNFSE